MVDEFRLVDVILVAQRIIAEYVNFFSKPDILSVGTSSGVRRRVWNCGTLESCVHDYDSLLRGAIADWEIIGVCRRVRRLWVG